MKSTMTLLQKLSLRTATSRSIGAVSILSGLFLALALTALACGPPGAGDDAMPQADATTGAGGEGSAPVAEPAMDHASMDHAAMDHAEGDADAAGGSIAVRFAAELFGENGGDYGLSFAPDGRSVFFTRAMPMAGNEAVYFSRLDEGRWSSPAAASFSGRFHDKEPYVSPDGGRVYFASRRPLRGATQRIDFDIWYAERNGAGWGDPVRVEAVSSPYNEDYPAVAADGTVVFSRDDDAGNVDLWVAAASARGLGEPQRLDRPIKSVYAEADPWIAADGRTIIFSSPRITEGSQGQGDLYVVHRQPDGWTAPTSLGLQVNSMAHEYGPALSADGTTFYFSRGFGGRVWMVPTAVLSGFDPARAR